MPHKSDAERLLDMSDALNRKLGGFFDLSEPMRDLLNSLCVDSVEYRPGHVLIGQDMDYSLVHLVENGWVVRSRILPTGGRQIVNVAVPGDFVGLNAMLFTSSDYDHVCRTTVSVFRIPPRELRQRLREYPDLAAALFWVNAHEESMLAERIVSLGRRSAPVRAAHVLCEFIARLEIIDAADLPNVVIPLSQEDFSDILGISLVHTNKCLRTLEKQEIITFRKGMLFVQDRAALERAAGFDEGYLHFTRREDRFSA